MEFAVVRDTLYVVESGGVLKKLVNGTLEPVLDISNTDNRRIMGILPYGEKGLLILTLRDGLYFF